MNQGTPMRQPEPSMGRRARKWANGAGMEPERARG